jgi:hypothetical protein
MLHTVIVARPALQYFSPLSNKRYDFRERKVIEHKMCVLLFSTTFPETLLMLRRIERDMIRNVYGSSDPFFFSNFY